MNAKDLVQKALVGMPTSRRHMNTRVAVLSYHSVSEAPGATPPALFETHMRWLNASCHVVPLAAILDHARGPRARPVVAVTFDDGFLDNLSAALPILLRYGIPASFFIATGLVDRDPSVLKAAAQWESWPQGASIMTWDHVLELRRAGMEIGAHGHGHVPLGPMRDPMALADLRESKELLEDQLGEPIRSVAFPYGRPRRHVTRRTIEIAATLGFEVGALVLYRRVRPDDHPLAIPRFVVSEDSLKMMQAKIFGSFDVLGLYQERAPLWAIRAIARKHYLS